MLRKSFSKILFAFVFLCTGVLVYAQDGAFTGYTPYSIYAIGDIGTPGSAYHKSMGGVGIASRNNKYINYLNPAAVTARDSLAFMVDVGFSVNTTLFRKDDARSVHNIYNINNLVMSFPIYKSSAIMVGIGPYSSTGYSFGFYDDDPQKIVDTGGRINNSVSGQGGLNELYVGAGVTFWKKLSIGAEWMYYFGNISKQTAITFTNTKYNGLISGYTVNLTGSTAKLGLQYEQPLGRSSSLTVGATYKFRTNLNGYIGDYSFSTGTVTDTLMYKVDTLGVTTSGINLASEIGVGVGFRYSNKLRAEFNYTRSDWTRSGYDNLNGMSVVSPTCAFSSTVSEAFRIGVEYTPNPNDIRYYLRTCSYRVGLFRKSEYFALDGGRVMSTGLSLGMTIPVFRKSNGLTFTAEFGQRGSLNKLSQTQERFVNFCVGFNAHDLWFHKNQYR